MPRRTVWDIWSRAYDRTELAHMLAETSDQGDVAVFNDTKKERKKADKTNLS